MLSMSLIAIVPLQLGLEGVWCGHIDVLEVVVPGVGSVSPGLGEGDAPGSPGSWGLRPGEGGHRGHKTSD